MRLSAETTRDLEEFFRQFFDDPALQLPDVQIYIRGGSKIVTGILGVDGITLGRHVFIKPAKIRVAANGRSIISQNLLAHEVTHVIQFAKQGFPGFLMRYFREYFRGLRSKKTLGAEARMLAYFEISHEIEARRAAGAFVKWRDRN